MKKEYVTPEAEMMKFIESEEIMTDPNSNIPGLDTGMGVVPNPF